MPSDGEETGGAIVSVAEALEFAKHLHLNGRLDEAESLYERILQDVPDHADAIQFFGLLKHFKGRSDEALTLMRRALVLAPDAPNLHNNLGRVLAVAGRSGEAEAAYRAALALDGDHLEALLNLGTIAETADRPDEAESLYRRALAVNPGHRPTYDKIIPLLFGRGRFVEAYTLGAQALEALPREQVPLRKLIAYYTALGETQKALAVAEEVLAADPGEAVMLHLRAALSGADVPSRASDAFLATTFDAFAHRFDKTLSDLGYRGPALVGAAVSDLAGEPRKGRDVLDAGCGTGLCGPYLAPFARRLVGVDLSPKMLEKARSRVEYDELHVVELVRYLAEHPRDFDLVASADTLIYFGGLSDFAAATAGALRPGGLLVVTVEAAESGNAAGFRLGPQGRYAHAPGYIRSSLCDAGFVAVELRPEIIRHEAGEPVAGFVVTAGIAA